MVITGAMSTFVNTPRYNDWKVNLKNLTKEHTYVAIAGMNNGRQVEALEKSKDINILYKGPMAVNKKSGHGHLPRNTVIIFELT